LGRRWHYSTDGGGSGGGGGGGGAGAAARSSLGVHSLDGWLTDRPVTPPPRHHRRCTAAPPTSQSPRVTVELCYPPGLTPRKPTGAADDAQLNPQCGRPANVQLPYHATDRFFFYSLFRPFVCFLPVELDKNYY